MMFALMKKLVVALGKLAVSTTIPEPGTTVLTCLIDFAAAQDNATQTALARIEVKLDDIHQNPFRLGKRILTDASRVANPELRRERIQRALDAFTQAAEYNHLGDPLLPLKARLSAGACYDLLQERDVALDHYEEIFRLAKELEALSHRAPDTTEGMDLLDRIGYWFDSREPDYKEKQQWIESLRQNKAELQDFLEHLLQLILRRKGVSREDYLKPWAPPAKKKRQPRPLSVTLNPHLNATRDLLPSNRTPLGSRYRFLTCPKCGKGLTFGVCPVCHGTQKFGIPVCARCQGRGTALACDCERGVNTITHRLTGTNFSVCQTCRGTGHIVFNNGKTSIPCPTCGGSGRKK